MKEKILVFSLVSAALSITGSSSTLAYLHDYESTVSVFTVGQVKIRNVTTSRDRSELPSDESLIDNSEEYETYVENNCTSMLGDDTCNKYIFVKNTGTTDAYVRVRILVPESLTSGSKPLITLNKNTASESENEFEERSNQSVPCNDNGLCTEYIFTREELLPAGSMTTYPAINGITLNVIANTGTEGENTSASSSPPIDLTTAGIRIVTEAIQAQGFNDADDAFAHF